MSGIDQKIAAERIAAKLSKITKELEKNDLWVFVASGHPCILPRQEKLDRAYCDGVDSKRILAWVDDSGCWDGGDW